MMKRGAGVSVQTNVLEIGRSAWTRTAGSVRRSLPASLGIVGFHIGEPAPWDGGAGHQPRLRLSLLPSSMDSYSPPITLETGTPRSTAAAISSLFARIA